MQNNVFYRCFSIGLKKRKLIKDDNNYLETVIDIINNGPTQDYYESIYLYTQEHYEQFEKTNSLAGIRNIHTNRIVFDFDNKNNIDLALEDTKILVHRLKKDILDNNIRVFYSGNKGFHVEIFINKLITRHEFEQITLKYAHGLQTFDERVKDEQRLFRFPLTQHQVTKRYKIPLSIEQLFTININEIINQSKLFTSQYADIIQSWDICYDSDKVTSINETKKEIPTRNVIDILTPDLTRRPKHLTPAKFVLQEGFFEEGERNEACMILASTYRFLGYNKELAYNMLKATLRLRAARLGLDDYDRDELWLTIIEPVYSPLWKGGVYSEKTGLLKKTIDRYNLQNSSENKDTIIEVEDVEKLFINFALNFDKNRIFTGLDRLDKTLVMTTGMGVGIVGSPGSGKTGFLLNMLEFNSMKGNHCFFGSHDMYSSLLYIRMIQKYYSQPMEKILDMIKHQDKDKKFLEALEQVKENFKNVGFNFQSGPNTQNISETLDAYEQRVGQKVRILAIDYLEKLTGPYSDATANSGFVSNALVDISRDKDLCLLLLLQPQKSTGDASKPLLSLRSAKGSSLIEQNQRVMLTMWRPGFNPANNNVDDKFASIAIVKNNMGPIGKFDFGWNGLSGRFRELLHEEQEELRQLLSRTSTEDDGDLF